MNDRVRELETLLKVTRDENQDLREELQLANARLSFLTKKCSDYKQILGKVLEIRPEEIQDE